MSDLPKNPKPFKVSREDYKEMLQYFEYIRDKAEHNLSNHNYMIFSYEDLALPAVGLLHLNCYNVCVLLRYVLENYDKIGTQGVDKVKTENPFMVFTKDKEQVCCVRKACVDAVSKKKDGLGNITTDIVIGSSTLTIPGDNLNDIVREIGALR